MKEFFNQIGTYITQYGLKILLCVCIVIVGICITWFVCFLLKKILLKTRIDGAIVSFIASIINWCNLTYSFFDSILIAFFILIKETWKYNLYKTIIVNPNKSNIISKSIAANGGIANYRGTVNISKDAINSKSIVFVSFI